MTDDITTTVQALLARAPEWIRRDLFAKDSIARTRAEEALAAMIADALSEAQRQ